MINAVSDAFYTMLSATSPIANLLSLTTSLFKEILLLKGRAVEFFPPRSICNFHGKLNLIFIPFINAPMLITSTATAQANPITRF